MKKILYLSMLIGLISFGKIATAQAVLIADNMVDDSYLAYGDNITGLFDLSSLKGTGIEELLVEFTFTDDNWLTPNDSGWNTDENNEAGQAGFIFDVREDYSSASTQAVHTYEVYQSHHQTVVETAAISLNGQTISTSSAYGNHSIMVYQGPVHPGWNGQYFLSPSDHPENDTLTQWWVAEGYTGIFSASYYLRGQELYDLLDTGSLAFNVASVSGDFMLTSATIDTNPVPEPASILLFGSALMGYAWQGRRRKRGAVLTSVQE